MADVKRIGRVVLLCAALALLLQACGGDDPPPDSVATSAPQADRTPAGSRAEPSDAESDDATAERKGSVQVEVIDTAFEPKEITVAAGTKVVWMQIGDQPHSVTANDESFDSAPDCGPIDTDRCDGEGDTFSFTFEEPGEYPYYCRVHGLPSGRGMTGTVTVEG